MIGVVEPGARAAVAASRRGELGVIGTAGTIGSGAYERAIKELAPNAHIMARACPLFVPLVEEGWLDTEPTRLIAREYRPMKAAGVTRLSSAAQYRPLSFRCAGDARAHVALIDSARDGCRDCARPARAICSRPPTVTTLGDGMPAVHLAS